MRLPDYIKQVGLDRFCKQFKVKPRTAYSWQRKERHPHRKTASRIVQSTPVTMEGIYGK